MRDLLLEFGDVFALASTKLGSIDVVQHQIDTGEQLPISTNQLIAFLLPCARLLMNLYRTCYSEESSGHPVVHGQVQWCWLTRRMALPDFALIIAS